MWGIDKDTAAKYGVYRICLPAKRARQRVAVSRMVDTFMDPRVLVVDDRYNKGVTIYCTCRRQANLLSNHFNGKIEYLLKVRYRRYADYHDKATAIEEILKANGVKTALVSCYSFEVEDKDDIYNPLKTKHIYIPCRRSAIMAKLSIMNLMAA